MFTGIIKDLGKVLNVEDRADRVFTIGTKLAIADMDLGASIACNGVCLTAIDIQPNQFKVQVSAETIARTTLGIWRQGTVVNLERPLRAGDELGGHIVAGHVDGLAKIIRRLTDGDLCGLLCNRPRS